MTQQALLVFVMLSAVFLAGVSMGGLMMRARLARLERINMRLDQRRLNALAKAWQSRAAALAPMTHEEAVYASNVREEIDSILTELEKR